MSHPVIVFGTFTYAETVERFGEHFTCELCQPRASPTGAPALATPTVSAPPQSPVARSSVAVPVPPSAVLLPAPSTVAAPAPSPLATSTVETPAPPAVAAPATVPLCKPSAWGAPSNTVASLFSGSQSNVKPAAVRISPSPPSSSATRPCVIPKPPSVKVEDDTAARRLGEFLRTRRLRGSHARRQPRGLVNRGTKCFVHAPLQCLLGFGPFVALLTDIFSLLKGIPRPHSATPVLDALVHFVSQFEPIQDEVSPTPYLKGRGKKSTNDFAAVPFEPSGIYDVLPAINGDLAQPGMQDSEEFLSGLLSVVHEEIQQVLQFGRPDVDVSTTKVEDEDPTEWEEVAGGRKNKSAVTRQVVAAKTPITALFGCELRSTVAVSGSPDSATFQPFNCLQLDIDESSINSIQDALTNFGRKEMISGFANGVDGKEVTAFRRFSFSRVSPVLIFHLKRFVFCPRSGPSKLMKQVKFGFKLTIPKDLLAPATRDCKVANCEYGLFAVAYHHGKTSQAGHYTSDVLQDGTDDWVRFSDKSISYINRSQVMQGSNDKTPYILMYRRVEDDP